MDKLLDMDEAAIVHVHCCTYVTSYSEERGIHMQISK